MTPARRDLLAMMEAALAAVDPFAAVQRFLRREGDVLHIGDTTLSLADIDRVWVIGAGKAGAPMAQAAEAVLGAHIAGGVVVVKHEHVVPLAHVELREAAHPVPDEAGLAAGEAVLALAEQATERDLVLCLISGGGSALLEALPEPLTLEELQATTTALLRSGATINELNAVRKHLSCVKGGQLARAIAPATLVTFVLSDVVGSPLDVIASGPTVPDASTWAEVAEIIARYRLADSLPDAVRVRIEQGAAGALPETPKADDPLFERTSVYIVGDNGQAAEAALRAAETRGYSGMILTTFLEGEAREVARVAVALAREVQANSRPLAPPACLILGGETTVTLRGEGKGGRNQEMALAAALVLAGSEDITIGALTTDGSDGPTDSTGAIVDGSSVARAMQQSLDAAWYLAQNNAYPLLDATGDMLRSGPTNTNVNDLLFILVR
ncbi:MAG: glycerate kinase [Ardenticatenales bacterium]|nr:glycerate kinase [Ardenticatenales bacterium]